MNLEFLISTMNRQNLDFFKDMNISSKSIIINQCKNKAELNQIHSVNDKYKCLSFNEKGISNSRNRAIENSTGDICVLCDDDVIYCNDAESVILESYKNNPNADIIVFQLQNYNGKLYKRYKNKKMNINAINSMRVSSVEITFRRDSIINNNIKFNSNFGAGTKYYCGEENIFLNDCIKKGLKIIYIPTVIATLQESDSSWFEGYNEQYFISKGAVFYKLYKKLYFIFILQFAIRKNKLFKKKYTIIDAIRIMNNGAKEIKYNGI